MIVECEVAPAYLPKASLTSDLCIDPYRFVRDNTTFEISKIYCLICYRTQK
jgi:hypothetical protein